MSIRLEETTMERGYYRIYLESSDGFKIPYVTYALSRNDAVSHALTSHDDIPALKVHEIQGPYVNMLAFECA
jgi:hypothetical protein